MDIEVNGTKKIRGVVIPPPDKSITHRYLFFSSIANETCEIKNPLISDDTKRTLSIIQNLGCYVKEENGIMTVKPSKFREPSMPLFCGNSGTTARIALGLIAREPIFAVLYGDESLSGRPMDRVVKPLKTLGARFDGRRNSSNLPIAVKGGSLKGVDYTSKVASAQVKTAFIIAALSASSNSTYKEPYESRDHSERFLEQFGIVEKKDGLITIHPSTIPTFKTKVVGDFSSAAFFMVLGAIHPNARVQIKNVGLNSTRMGLLNVLKKMNLKMEIVDYNDDVEPYGTVIVESSNLQGVSVYENEIPSMIDEVPLLALAGAFATGETIVRGAGELRKKESDRIKATVEILSKMGATIEEYEDGFRVIGSRPLHKAKVESFGDHRMAMLASVAGLCSDGVKVKNADCVSISYPDFFLQLERLVKG